MIHLHGVVSRRVRHVFAALAQPPLHEFDLVLLRDVDASGNVADLRAIGAVGDELGHLERLMVVRNHVLHEPDVGRGVAGVRDNAGLLGTELP